jgi:mRNA interferase RelE/StbE
MSYIVEYEPEALADLEKLTKSVRERVVKKINWLAENFNQIKLPKTWV